MSNVKQMWSLSSRSSSSDSDSLTKASSLSSHQLGRNLAKLAVDSANLADAIRKGLKHDDVQKGIRSDSIKGDLGDDEFKVLCENSGLALVTINYCQRGLEHLGQHLNKEKLSKDSGKSDVSQKQVEEIKKMRAPINHDFLVLELHSGGSSAEKFYILAEKLGMGGKRNQAGIFISHNKAEDVENILFHEHTKLYGIKCGKKHIPLETLLDILKEVDPNYSLRNSNCWDYATAT